MNQAKLIGYSKNHIDIEVTIDGIEPWRLTEMYGEPDRSQRRTSWDLLRNLAKDSNLPWCMTGDLNNIKANEDKRGGSQYPDWLMEGFNEVLSATGLTDIDFVGHQFTWEKGRATEDLMEVRLDRALTCSSWLQSFPLSKFYNLEFSVSDHSPLLLVPKPVNVQVLPSHFRLENSWLTKPLCEQLTRDSWKLDSTGDIQQKVKRCGEKFWSWGKELLGNFGRRIKGCQFQLKRLRHRRDIQSQIEYNAARKQLSLVLNQREIF